MLAAAAAISLFSSVVVAVDWNLGVPQVYPAAFKQSFEPTFNGLIRPQALSVPAAVAFVPQFMPQIQEQPEQNTHKKRLGRRWRKKHKQNMAKSTTNGHQSCPPCAERDSLESIRAKVNEAQAKLVEAQRILDEIGDQVLASLDESPQPNHDQGDGHDDLDLEEEDDSGLHEEEDTNSESQFTTNRQQSNKVHHSGSSISSQSSNQPATTATLGQGKNPDSVRIQQSVPIFSGQNGTPTQVSVNIPVQPHEAGSQPNASQHSEATLRDGKTTHNPESESHPIESKDHPDSHRTPDNLNPYDLSRLKVSSSAPDSPPKAPNSEAEAFERQDPTDQSSQPTTKSDLAALNLKAENFDSNTGLASQQAISVPIPASQPSLVQSNEPGPEMVDVQKHADSVVSREAPRVVKPNSVGVNQAPNVVSKARESQSSVSNNPYINQPTTRAALSLTENSTGGPTVPSKFDLAKQMHLASPSSEPSQHQQQSEEDIDDIDGRFGGLNDLSESDDDEEEEEFVNRGVSINGASKSGSSRADQAGSDFGPSLRESLSGMRNLHPGSILPSGGQHSHINQYPDEESDELDDFYDEPTPSSNQDRRETIKQANDYLSRPDPFAVPTSRSGAQQRSSQQQISTSFKSFAVPGGYGAASNQQQYSLPGHRQPQPQNYPPLQPLQAMRAPNSQTADDDDDGFDQEDLDDPESEVPNSDEGGKKGRGGRFRKFFTNKANKLKHIGRKMINSNYIIHDAIEKTKYRAAPRVKSMLDQTRQAAQAVQSRFRAPGRVHHHRGEQRLVQPAPQADSLTLSRTIPDRLGQYPMVPPLNNQHQNQHTFRHVNHFDTKNLQTRTQTGLHQERTTDSKLESVSHSLDGQRSSFRKRSSSFSYSATSSSSP